jgi:hypothetical protein
MTPTPATDQATTWQAPAMTRPRQVSDAGAPGLAISGGFTTLFSRYSQHFLMRNPYTDAPNLLHHVYGLGVHLATLRLLVVGHPRLAAVLASDPHPDDDRRILDEVVVHVVQTFTKAVSHHPAFLRAAGVGAGTAEDAMTFGRLVLLAKFV